MKLTLQEIVQDILSKLNGDEVNSIGDTVEATQIAYEVRATYYDLLQSVEWPYQYNLRALEPSGDTARPTHMRTPELVDNFKYLLYYNTALETPTYQEVCYLKPEDFIWRTQHQAADYTMNVTDYSGAYLRVGTNKQPQFYTMFDDEHVVFDSYDAALDDTLQASKVLAMAQTIPVFEMRDDYYPELPVKYYPLLLAESTAACMWYQKQMQSPVDEKRARRGYVRLFNNRHTSQDADKSTVNFGRS